MRHQIFVSVLFISSLGCVTSLNLKPAQAGYGSLFSGGIRGVNSERPDAQIGGMIFIGLGVLGCILNVAANSKK